MASVAARRSTNCSFGKCTRSLQPSAIFRNFVAIPLSWQAFRRSCVLRVARSEGSGDTASIGAAAAQAGAGPACRLKKAPKRPEAEAWLLVFLARPETEARLDEEAALPLAFMASVAARRSISCSFGKCIRTLQPSAVFRDFVAIPLSWQAFRRSRVLRVARSDGSGDTASIGAAAAQAGAGPACRFKKAPNRPEAEAWLLDDLARPETEAGLDEEAALPLAFMASVAARRWSSCSLDKCTRNLQPSDVFRDFVAIPLSWQAFQRSCVLRVARSEGSGDTASIGAAAAQAGAGPACRLKKAPKRPEAEAWLLDVLARPETEAGLDEEAALALAFMASVAARRSSSCSFGKCTWSLQPSAVFRGFVAIPLSWQAFRRSCVLRVAKTLHLNQNCYGNAHTHTHTQPPNNRTHSKRCVPEASRTCYPK